MKAIEKLQNFVTTNRRKTNVNTSLSLLLRVGFARTGQSGYSNGWATKSIWTEQVVAQLVKLGINFEAGNDAPKHGANGEYIKLKGAILKDIKSHKSMC